jgi:hypothetical protein
MCSVPRDHYPAPTDYRHHKRDSHVSTQRKLLRLLLTKIKMMTMCQILPKMKMTVILFFLIVLVWMMILMNNFIYLSVLSFEKWKQISKVADFRRKFFDPGELPPRGKWPGDTEIKRIILIRATE